MKKYKILLFLSIAAVMTGCKESKTEMFERIAKEISSKCPRAINEFTRLDSVVYVPDKNMNQYYYTLTGSADNKENVEANRQEMESALINDVANSMELKVYKDYGVTLEYIYHSEKYKSVLFDLKITSHQYHIGKMP